MYLVGQNFDSLELLNNVNQNNELPVHPYNIVS